VVVAFGFLGVASPPARPAGGLSLSEGEGSKVPPDKEEFREV